MTTYVLLALLMTTTPRPATWTAEFTTLERCQDAGERLKKMVGSPSSWGYPRYDYICTEK